MRIEIKVDAHESGVSCRVVMEESKGYNNAPAITQGHIEKVMQQTRMAMKESVAGMRPQS